MLMVDANGIPLAIDVVSASAAEVNRIEPLLEERVLEERVLARQPERLMYDRAADSDPLRARLAGRKIELICRHRRGRRKSPTQDGRAARRLARPYRVERSIGGSSITTVLSCGTNIMTPSFEDLPRSPA